MCENTNHVQTSFKILSEEKGFDHIVVCRVAIGEEGPTAALDSLFDTIEHAEGLAVERGFRPFAHGPYNGSRRSQSGSRTQSSGSSNGGAPSDGVPTTYEKDGRTWEQCGAGIIEKIVLEDKRVGFQMSNRQHPVYANKPMNKVTPLFAPGVLDGDAISIDDLTDVDRTLHRAKGHFGILVGFSGKSTDRGHWDVIKIRAGSDDDVKKYA